MSIFPDESDPWIFCDRCHHRLAFHASRRRDPGYCFCGCFGVLVDPSRPDLGFAQAPKPGPSGPSASKVGGVTMAEDKSIVSKKPKVEWEHFYRGVEFHKVEADSTGRFCRECGHRIYHVY